MEMTLRELVQVLDPVMTPSQLVTLTQLALIPPLGVRHTGHPGRPGWLYDSGAVRAAHAEEAARTVKQFSDSDWIASAMLARGYIRADAEAGELWWTTTGERAEYLGTGNYGWVKFGPCRVPAHRVIWIAADGEIPEGIQVNHINKRRWDNRRVNLELVTFGNNIRHGHGAPYITYHDAIRELIELAPDPLVPAINPYGDHFQGGRIIGGNMTHRRGH